MKFLKWVLVVVGGVGLLIGGWYLFQSWVGIGKMMAVAVSNRSVDFPSPMSSVYLATGLCLAAGFLLGLGVGLPGRRTPVVNGDRLTAPEPVAGLPQQPLPSDDEEGSAGHEEPPTWQKPI